MDTLHDTHTICDKKGMMICIMLDELLRLQGEEPSDNIVNEFITPLLWELIEQMQPIEE